MHTNRRKFVTTAIAGGIAATLPFNANGSSLSSSDQDVTQN